MPHLPVRVTGRELRSLSVKRRHRTATNACTRAVVVAGVLLVAAAAAVPTAGAEEASDEASPAPKSESNLTIDEIGEGSCFPAVTLPGRQVECRFPLLGEGWTIDQFDLPVLADLDVSFDDDQKATCSVESDELVCPHLDAFYRFGRTDVSISLGFGRPRQLAAFEIVDPVPYGVDAFWVGGTEPIAMPGRPAQLTVYSFDEERVTPTWIEVRQRGSDDVLDVIEATTGEPGEGLAVTAIPAPEAPGRYLATLCVGDSATECDPVPGVFGFQVVAPELRQLVEGHNKADAQRINLVFAGSGFDNTASFISLAKGLLALDGPVPIDIDGRPISGALDELEPREVFDLAWGPFSIEPLRSNVDRFNFWYLSDDVVDVRALFHNAHPEFSRPDELAGFELDHVSVITIDHQTDGYYGRSEANWTSFRLTEDVPHVDDIEFAGVYLAVDGFWPYGAATTLAHEFGHALFDLRDEYVEFTRDVQHGFPNCAVTIDEAFEWWGDDVGEVDPFIHTYIDLQRQFDLWAPDELVDDITVGFEAGGCYGGLNGVVRPSANSLMNGEIPVFGAVNRRRVEELLGQFSGRSSLVSYVDVVIGCLPGSVAIPGRIVQCTGSLAEGLDAPDGSLRISVAGRMGDCVIGEVDEVGVRGVTCDGIELTGQGPWTVSVTIDSQLAQFVTQIENPLVTTVRFGQARESARAAESSTTIVAQSVAIEAPTETSEPATSAVTGDGTTSLPWSVGAAVFAALFVAVGGYLWTRSNTRAAARRNDDSDTNAEQGP